MALLYSITILCLILIATSIEAKPRPADNTTVHAGQCPSNNLLGHIQCRRRVCLPEELIPLCKGDTDCATTHKCCRPMCSCHVQCVEAIKENN